MYFFLKYLVTLFYKKLRIKIVVSFLCESGPRTPFQSCHYKDQKVVMLFVNGYTSTMQSSQEKLGKL